MKERYQIMLQILELVMPVMQQSNLEVEIVEVRRPNGDVEYAFRVEPENGSESVDLISAESLIQNVMNGCTIEGTAQALIILSAIRYKRDGLGKRGMED